MSADFSRWICRVCGLVAAAGAGSVHAGVVTDGTVGPRVRLDGDFEIGADLGRRAGRNLFHSFERFSLETGERATFSGPDEIRNVISRVTGGARSEIDGTLRSTIPGADLYFLNPAGAMFGPNARLDLQGSFHVSTADELRFANGAKFSATNPAASSFSIARPEAFGFLGSAPAAILVDRGVLAVPAGEALSLVGGDVTIRGDLEAPSAGGSGTLFAEAGTITLAAGAGHAHFNIANGALDAEQPADIRLQDQALVEASGNGGGTIRIRGGAFVVEGRSFLFADNTGALDATGEIRAEIDRITMTGGSALTADVFGTGNAAVVTIVANEMEVLDGGEVRSSTFGEGRAGAVMVDAGRLRIVGNGVTFTGISSDANAGSGNAGVVQVGADDLTIQHDGAIRSLTVTSGSAGTVGVTAGQIRILATGATVFTGISSDAGEGSSGNAGAVNIQAGNIQLADGGMIRSDTFGADDAGTVNVSAGRIEILGDGINLTGIGSTARAGSGHAGVVNVNAAHLQIRRGGEIGSQTFTQGNGGTVLVQAGRIRIDGAGAEVFTGISSDAQETSSGGAGAVRVEAEDLELHGGAEIRSDASGLGDAGSVEVSARRIEIVGDGAAFTGISSSSDLGGSGGAGVVNVEAADLEIRDGGAIRSVTFTEGNAGTVRVEAGTVRIIGSTSAPLSGISTETQGAGRAGEVTLEAEDVEIRQGGEISSNTFGDGPAGTVSVRTERLLIVRGGSANFTGISSSAADGSGTGGVVAVAAGDLELRAGGAIGSVTLTRGAGGTVEVSADRIVARGGGLITASTAGPGHAGSVVVDADEVLVTGPASSIASAAIGRPGGRAGDVTIRAPIVTLSDGGTISSSNAGDGRAGEVTIEASHRLLLDRGVVSTDSAAAGGGEIRLLVGDVIDLRDSDIVTSVAGGTDPTAGDILIDPKILVIDGSRIKADAGTGRGGNIRIIADNILVFEGDLEDLLARGDISASGLTEEVNGTIAIAAPEVDLSGGLVVLEGALLDAASQLRERCAARRDIGTSSFTGVGRGGLPPTPDGPLAGAYASRFGSPGVALVPEERGGAVSAEEHSVERAIWPAVAGLAPCHGAL